jgi:hypothetical protein
VVKTGECTAVFSLDDRLEDYLPMQAIRAVQAISLINKGDSP